jgi:hypothetical protein
LPVRYPILAVESKLLSITRGPWSNAGSSVLKTLVHGNEELEVPIVIIIAILLDVVGVIQIALDFPLRLALFGLVLGNASSAVVRILTILGTGVIILGLWKRFWAAAIAYAVINLVSVISSFCNYLRLGPDEIQQITGVRAQSMPSTYMAIYVILVTLLTFAVIRQRKYFSRHM